MPDIFHQFPIKASAQRVFDAVSTPAGLDAWWTLSSAGQAEPGAEFQLYFGPEYDWRAVVSRCLPGKEFELQLTQAMQDWVGTRVGFSLSEQDGITTVRFRHTGWPQTSEHFRISCYCWATYLRLLKRYLEHGEIVPYNARDDA